jgi:hypothetical protein
MGPRTPDNDMVICPNCTCQFVAIPVNVQARLAEAERLRGLLDRAEDALLELDSHTHIQPLLDDIHAALGVTTDQPEAKPHRCSVELTGAQICDLYELYTDEDAETMWTVGYSDTVIDEGTGQYEPPGLYVHLSEYPEEGYIGPLGATPTVTEVQK